MPINIEIKARCSGHDRVRESLRSLGAAFRGCDHQIDTYFKISDGRLKLREGTIENALIFYRRTDDAGPKRSAVLLYPTEPNSSLKQILTTILGVQVVVDKLREIYFVDNVKIHIDTVAGLGKFVEIEAQDVDVSISIEKLHEQCRRFMELFNISQEDLLSRSYSDLLMIVH